jgi:hypothetical protein
MHVSNWDRPREGQRTRLQFASGYYAERSTPRTSSALYSKVGAYDHLIAGTKPKRAQGFRELYAIPMLCDPGDFCRLYARYDVCSDQSSLLIH